MQWTQQEKLFTKRRGKTFHCYSANGSYGQMPRARAKITQPAAQNKAARLLSTSAEPVETYTSGIAEFRKSLFSRVPEGKPVFRQCTKVPGGRLVKNKHQRHFSYLLNSQ